MRGPDGAAIPIIGRSEHKRIMVSVLKNELADAVTQGADEEELNRILEEIVDGDEDAAAEFSSSLSRDGRVKEVRYLDTAKASAFALDLLEVLSSAFVVIAVIPQAYAGKRVILKYSHIVHPHTLETPWWNRAKAAAGLSQLAFLMPLGNASAAKSYHLELSVPTELVCTDFNLPGKRSDRNAASIVNDGVAHAASSYESPPNLPAIAAFTVPWRGLRATAWVVALTTFAFLYMGLVLPGAPEALAATADGAAALLLGIPAVVVTFSVWKRESTLETLLLGPLRMCIIVCALILVIGAASIVGKLNEPFRTTLWTLGSIYSGGMCLFLISSEARSRLGKGWTAAVAILIVAGFALWACGIWLW